MVSGHWTPKLRKDVNRMEKQEVFERVSEVIADVLVIDESDVTLDLSQDSCDNWDSLAQITLLVSIETEFGIKFTASQMSSMHSVGEIVDEISKMVD